MTYFDDVKRFHLFYRKPPSTPTLPDGPVWARRVRLVSEEWSELARAVALEDIVGYADGLVDLTWVVLGTAVEAGLPYEVLWEEVKRANYAKFPNGTFSIDASGKIVKPPGWKPPDIARILAEVPL